MLPWGDPSLEDIIDRDLFQQLQVSLAMNLYRFTMLLCPVYDISKYQVASSLYVTVYILLDTGGDRAFGGAHTPIGHVKDL